MKTLTVQEASQSLGDWLRRAVRGEQIAIHSDNCTVLLQPLAQPGTVEANRPSPLDALRELQARAQLTAAEANCYLREVRDERLRHGHGE